MRQQESSMRIFLFAVFSIFSSCIASEILNCSLPNLSFNDDNGQKINIKNPIIYLNYNRNSLGIYQYPGTPSVNLLINDADISVKGKINNGSGVDMEKLFATEILGVANIVNITNYNNGLKDCEFFIKDKLTKSFYNSLPSKLQKKVFQLVEECTNVQLCKKLGAVRQDDLNRAKVNPQEFGPLSIESRTLQISFPKMIAPKLTENKQSKKGNIIEAVDSIIATIAKTFLYENNGTIKIPNIQRLFNHASKGTFVGLNNLQRDKSVQIRASPPSEATQTFSFSFEIPKGHVKYADFKVIQIFPFSGQLCADVRNMVFTATIQMDFKENYCRSNMTKFSVESPGNAKSYTCGRFSSITNLVMQWFVKAWNVDVVQVIAKQIERAMRTHVYDNFDCENFRPNLV